MELNHGIHLGYCTNIHRGESWEQTWRGLRDHTLQVRRRVAGGKPYGIGLRLSAQAAQELNTPCMIAEFQEWLEANNCYVFTINGFPYGAFHGTRVKEQVFKPDWTTHARIDYTNLLFDILAKLLPKTSFYGHLVLQQATATKDGYSAGPNHPSALVGATGQTVTALRPAGSIALGEQRLDVVTRGEFIEVDSPVRIVEVHGNRVVVELVVNEGKA